MTDSTTPFLAIKRLQVFRRGHAAYDQKFHRGVNIVRGQNGSGKSTIADFIFYALGGDDNNWKGAATECDSVVAEIETSRGVITIRRDTQSKGRAIDVSFQPLIAASKNSVEGWTPFPLRRSDKQISFSQMMFRSMGIPEAKSDGASNITMHQLLRLLYSDQRTPASRLFRYDRFDTQNIREAVGELVCGISGYNKYEKTLELRDKEKKFDVAASKLKALIAARPDGEVFQSFDGLNALITNLRTETISILGEIENIDELVEQDRTAAFLTERKSASSDIAKLGNSISLLSARNDELSLDIEELQEFTDYLNELKEKVLLAESTLAAAGDLNFHYCPACLKEISNDHPASECGLCGKDREDEDSGSKYNQIRLDIEFQLQETSQLLDQRTQILAKQKRDLRVSRSNYRRSVQEFSLKFELSSSPREAFLAEKNNRLGQINQEIKYLEAALSLATEIDEARERKSTLQREIDVLKEELTALVKSADKRKRIALTAVSKIGSSILRDDLNRQEEFENADNLKIDFKTDAILVDDTLNFAESSNVFLKNSAILSLLLASSEDAKFYHPRFLLLDNIEDKGMEEERSHRFQELLVKRATEIKVPFQVIYTTSMMNPALELDDYVIGPAYTRENKTLDLGIPNASVDGA